jgi:hypothetical protein
MYRFVATALALAALAATAGCMSPPKDLDLALTRPTVDKKYVVTLQPPAKPAAINQLHAWQVKIASPAGVPVAGARIWAGPTPMILSCLKLVREYSA